MLNEGNKVNFEGIDTNGAKISYSDYKKNILVLYFYPKDDTPGCTTEACTFRDDESEYKKRNAKIVGVSWDDSKSHRKFTDKHSLPFTLIADTDRKISEFFGAINPKGFLGKPSIIRCTFIIKNGKVAKVFPKVNPIGHSKEILDAIDNL